MTDSLDMYFTPSSRSDIHRLSVKVLLNYYFIVHSNATPPNENVTNHTPSDISEKRISESQRVKKKVPAV